MGHQEKNRFEGHYRHLQIQKDAAGYPEDSHVFFREKVDDGQKGERYLKEGEHEQGVREVKGSIRDVTGPHSQIF